jgi:hypothetical protein
MPKIGRNLSMTLFANQQIKPKSIVWRNEIVDVFPLYASIIYGSDSSTIKVEIKGSPILVSPDLAQINEPELKELIDHFKNHTLGVVEKEILQANGKEYILTGISVRLRKYETPINRLISELTIESALKRIGNSSTKSLFQFADLISKMELIEKLTVYDWIFGKGKSLFENRLNGIDVEKKTNIAQMIDTLIA